MHYRIAAQSAHSIFTKHCLPVEIILHTILPAQLACEFEFLRSYGPLQASPFPIQHNYSHQSVASTNVVMGIEINDELRIIEIQQGC